MADGVVEQFAAVVAGVAVVDGAVGLVHLESVGAIFAIAGGKTVFEVFGILEVAAFAIFAVCLVDGAEDGVFTAIF